MHAIGTIFLAVVFFSGMATYFAEHSPGGDRQIYTPDGQRRATTKSEPPSPSGPQRFQIYAPNGARLGYGDTEKDGRTNIYTPGGDRILVIPPTTPTPRK